MTSQPPAHTTATTAQRIGWAVLISATLFICYFSHLGVIGFVGPDEPRYAWIARDMAETGDWVTPRLYGKPWFEKPPLLYWGGAIFFHLIPGQPEVAARLPSAISALLATLALAWLAWRTYGEECARWLLLLLPTSVGMIGFSHAAATDMPFSGMLTIAMVCAAVILGLAQSEENRTILPRTPWLALLLFGFFLGLAVLAKGPAAIILCGGAVFFWAVITKRWRDALRLLHPAAIASFCLTALPWYILCARRNPDFFRIFIIEHNFKRFLTPEFQHVQPFWFYIPILLIAFLPWIATLVTAFILGLQRVRQEKPFHQTTLLLLSWSSFCLLFFTISKSKLPGYVLPAIPALALLVARVAVVALAEKSRLFRYSAIAAVVLLSLTAGAVSVIAGITAHTSYSTSSLGVGLFVVFLFFAIANGFLWVAVAHPPSTASSIRLYAATGLVLPILLTMLSVNRLRPYFFYSDPSGKTVAEEVLSHKIPPRELTVHRMNRGMQYGLSFYLREEILNWDSSHPRVGYLLLGSKGCQHVVGESVSCEQPPVFFEASERFLYKVFPKTLLDGAGGGREPK